MRLFIFFLFLSFLAYTPQKLAADEHNVYLKPSRDKTWWDEKLEKSPWLRKLTGQEYSFARSVAIVVGIDTYVYWEDLASPVNDAHRVRDFLIESGFDEVHTLTNENVTREAVEKLITKFAGELGPSDRFFFYWTGHGGKHDEEGFGFLPLPSSPQSGNGDPIVMAETQNWMRRIKVRHSMFVLDTCFSGSALQAKAPLRRVALERMARPVDLILASSTQSQRSYGYKDGSGGLLTSSFLRAVGANGLAPSADNNNDGIVTATEVFSEIKTDLQFVEGSEGFIQTPYMRPFGGNDEGEFFFVSSEIGAAPPEQGNALRVADIEDAGPDRIEATEKQTEDFEASLPDFALDALTNIVREENEEPMIIRPTVSEYRKRRNLEQRQSLLSAAKVTTEKALLSGAVNKLLLLIDGENTSRGKPARQPKTQISDFNLYEQEFDEGRQAERVRRYFKGCSRLGDMFDSVQTASELVAIYHTVLTQLYSGDRGVIQEGWGNGLRLSSSGSQIPFISTDMGSAELALNSWINMGILEDHYDIFAGAIDELEFEWRSRIANFAKVALEYRSILRVDLHDEPQPPFLRWEAAQKPRNPFDCERTSEIQIYTEVEFKGHKSVSVGFAYSEVEPFLYSGYHDWMFAFWARRIAANTDQELGDFFRRIATDFSGPTTPWEPPEFYLEWVEAQNFDE
jgi:Caspase domain